MIRAATNVLITGLLCMLGLVMMGGAQAAPRVKPPAPATAAGPAAVPAGQFVLEILHTNDMHGHLRPGVGNRGGAGAIAARIAAARQRARTDPNFDALVVDAGDIFGGTAEDSFSGGKMMADFLAGAGYDVWVVGNHDFGFGLETLYQTTARLRDAKMAVLGANIIDKSTSQTATRIASGAILVDKKGYKIGIIGVTTPGVEHMNLNEFVTGYDFPDPIAIVKEKAEKLTAAGATLVIVVSHVGHDNGKYVDDKKIAAAVPGVRVIVGGHSHTALKHPFVEPSTGALIVQSGSQTRNLGELQLTFDAKTHKPLDADGDGAVDHTYELVDLKALPGAHPLIDELRAKYWDPIQGQLTAKVGIAEETLYRKFYKTETQLGNLLADALLDAVPGAQAAIIGNSDMRADLYKGDIQYKDVFAVVPFDNEVVKMTVPGKLLREVMDDCYGNGRHFAQVAGMRVVVDSRKGPGERIQSIRIGDDLVTDEGQYVLATSDFIAQGKAGFSQFTKPTYDKTGVKIRDALVKRIQKMGTLTDAGIPMGRLRDLVLSEEIGRVTQTFSTEMFAPGPNLFDIVVGSVLGSPARGDLALIDAGEIHWRLSEKFPIVRRDLNELVPFDRNALVTASITGQQLNDVFATFIPKKPTAGAAPRLRAYIAGGQLVIHGQQFELLIAGKPVVPSQTYTLVTYDHLLTGPQGFQALGKLGLKGKPVGVMMRESLEAWIKQMTPIGAEDFPGGPAIVMDGAVARTANRIANFQANEEPAGDDPAPEVPATKARPKKAGGSESAEPEDEDHCGDACVDHPE